jgi:hypothetical protein
MRQALLFATATALALHTPVDAQTTHQPDLPRGDIAVVTGWIRAQRDELEPQVYRTTYSEPLGALIGGVYWTEHLKTEIEGGGSGQHQLFGSERIELGRGFAQNIYRTHYVSARTFSVTQSWQFFHNTWVHPFVGAGIDLDWQRRRTEVETFLTTPTSYFNDRERLPDEVERSVKVRGALATGFKFYATRRAFVRTDVRISLRDGFDAIRWRIGGGIDF